VQVDPQPSTGQGAHDVGERLCDRLRGHVRAQALCVQADDEAVVLRSGSRDATRFDDVWVGYDDRAAVPPVADLVRRPFGQRHDDRRRADENAKLGVVHLGVGVVRIAQVVHGDDERNVRLAQGGDDVLELFGRLLVEAEVDVEDVEVSVMLADPSGVEHHRRPPATRDVAAVRRRHVVQADDAVVAVGIRRT